ncbi:MAG: hypothetical protein V1824_00155, partial [archaeon]
FLNNLANDLEKNISFKKALENRVDASILGQKIKLALYYTNKLGYPLSQGLQIICEGNSDFEKVVSQLEDIITSGNKNKAQVLRTISESLTENQYNRIRSYSSKLSFISLVFIAVSAIVPALFLMFILIGSNFLELSFTPLSIVLITIVLFPIIDIVLLFILRNSLP